MSQAITVAERYIAAWNEKNPAARRDALSAQWARSAVYRDPIAHAEGLDAIDSMIAGVQTRFPAFRFALKQPATGYGDIVRLAWSLGPEFGRSADRRERRRRSGGGQDQGSHRLSRQGPPAERLKRRKAGKRAQQAIEACCRARGRPEGSKGPGCHRLESRPRRRALTRAPPGLIRAADEFHLRPRSFRSSASPSPSGRSRRWTMCPSRCRRARSLGSLVPTAPARRRRST